MSIKLQIEVARKQIGEAWSQLDQARQTLEKLGVPTELQTHQRGLYVLAMTLEDQDLCEGGSESTELEEPAITPAKAA